MPLLVVVVGLPLIIWGERYTMGGGWGHDGQNYGKWATDFSKWVLGKKMEAYYVGRVLPSAIIHYSLRLLDIELTRINIIRAFQIFNLLVLMIAALSWTGIARRLELGRLATWVGFIAIFVNFPFLKSALYNPLTLNPSALMLGMVVFYAYLARNQILLVAICCVGAFIWPTVLPTGMLLFVFPRRELAVERARLGLNQLVGLAAVVFLLWVINYYYFDKSFEVFNKAHAPHISASFVYLSVVCVVVFAFFAIAQLADLRALYRPSSYVSRSTWLGVAIRAVIAVALFMAARRTYQHFGPLGSGPTLEFYYGQVIFGALVRPLQFLVSHVVLFGPIVILVVLRWRDICRRMHGYGIGLVLFMLTLMLQAISAQSRQMIPYLPVLVGFAVLAWEEELPRLKVELFAALCFLYSKIWFPINVVKLHGSPRHWPLQRFFMNHGPWMNLTMYIVQGAFVLLTFMYIYFLFRTPDGRPAGTDDSDASVA